jgi:hypothetical protein
MSRGGQIARDGLGEQPGALQNLDHSVTVRAEQHPGTQLLQDVHGEDARVARSGA